MINVGIVGYGKMGQIRAAALQASTRARVVAVAETNVQGGLPDGARLMAPEEVIALPDVDAVFVCTPNSFNRPYTIDALRAGKHVFCEKPPAFNAAEVEEIRAVEKESGLKLMYGFNHRHHESILKMKEMIDSKISGRILWMRGRYGKSVDESFYKGWRSQKKLAGGGILLDQGIHMLDLFLFMGGDFDEVQAFVSKLYWKLDIEDNVFAIMRNSKTQVVASLHSTMTQWRHLFSLEVFCENGYFVLNGLNTSSQSYGEEVLSIARDRSEAPVARWRDEERILYTTDVSWQSEVGHFLDAVELGTEIRFGTSDDALKLMRLIDRIYAADQ